MKIPAVSPSTKIFLTRVFIFLEFYLAPTAGELVALITHAHPEIIFIVAAPLIVIADAGYVIGPLTHRVRAAPLARYRLLSALADVHPHGSSSFYVMENFTHPFSITRSGESVCVSSELVWALSYDDLATLGAYLEAYATEKSESVYFQVSQVIPFICVMGWASFLEVSNYGAPGAILDLLPGIILGLTTASIVVWAYGALVLPGLYDVVDRHALEEINYNGESLIRVIEALRQWKGSPYTRRRIAHTLLTPIRIPLYIAKRVKAIRTRSETNVCDVPIARTSPQREGSSWKLTGDKSEVASYAESDGDELRAFVDSPDFRRENGLEKSDVEELTSAVTNPVHGRHPAILLTVRGEHRRFLGFIQLIWDSPYRLRMTTNLFLIDMFTEASLEALTSVTGILHQYFGFRHILPVIRTDNEAERRLLVSAGYVVVPWHGAVVPSFQGIPLERYVHTAQHPHRAEDILQLIEYGKKRPTA